MTEDFLHFIWKYGLFDREDLLADTGEPVQVITLGEHNTDAGPDFLNARIKVGATLWAGNVEIHMKSSDWQGHQHQVDKAYDNVILHVVYQNNQPVHRNSGEMIPTLELRFDAGLYDAYCQLLARKRELPCGDRITKVDPLITELWLNSLVVERLSDKTRHLSTLLEAYRNDWEEVFYISLARSFGFGLNATPFELLARSLPLSHLARHRGNPLQMEALLFGQAGFLDQGKLFDPYSEALRREYNHLKHKYNLTAMEKHLWKFLRLRPVNFPTIRIAQFAALMGRPERLFSQVLACHDIAEVSGLFNVQASQFWNNHYTFETLSPVMPKNFGTAAVQILIINTVVPFLFLYGKSTALEDLKEKALSWLGMLPAEDNRLVNRWKDCGMKVSNAFDTQGVIQLVNLYCNRKRCLACSVGSHIITTGLQ
jgi:hypothetical protein